VVDKQLQDKAYHYSMMENFQDNRVLGLLGIWFQLKLQKHF